MTLDEVWTELEDEITPEQHHGRRRIHASSPIDLNITVTRPGPRRGLSLTVPARAVSDSGDLPSTKSIEHTSRPAAATDYTVLELRLTNPSANELFVAMASDIARATSKADDDEHAVGTWLSRIRSWQKLMARAPSGLSEEAQIGLYAELCFVREISSIVGLTAAVDGWQGPIGGHDLQLEGGAFEVKGTASHEPQVVRISSERQLDETGTDGLHLVHFSLDIHRHAGESLPELVAALREVLVDTGAEHIFEDRLVDAGYTDVHEPRYEPTGYTVREENFFRIAAGFPRIVESDLPEGVGGVQYKLVIAACADFAIQARGAFSALRALQ